MIKLTHNVTLHLTYWGQTITCLQELDTILYVHVRTSVSVCVCVCVCVCVLLCAYSASIPSDRVAYIIVIVRITNHL